MADMFALFVYAKATPDKRAEMRKNTVPNSWTDDFDLVLYRKHIESVYSQLESMG
jgi:hypothetical protein